jgi:hypothetical protein
VTVPPFFSTGPMVVPVNACSSPIQVPSGIATIDETPQVGVAVENVTAYSYDQYGNYINELDSWTPPQQTATVTVVPGGVNLETVATFTNYEAPPGQLKICKVAGQGVAVGTLFYFTATDGTTQRMDQVEAGPGPGGYCVVDGTWPVNDLVTITETNIPAGVSVSNITFNGGLAGACNPPASYCGAGTIISGINEATFTDVSSVTQGSCQPSESLSVMVLPTGNGCTPPPSGSGCVAAFVPKGNWTVYGSTGIAVTNVEGSYIVGAPLLVATTYQGVNDYINSCASDPMLTPPQTVCTASSEITQSSNVYVIEGNNPPAVAKVLQTTSSGQVEFSGGWCTNCGVAVDAIHSKAVIGISLSGSGCGQSLDVACPPGFQFLNLVTDQIETPAWPSNAGQISEDSLIDPIRGLLLSAAEGQYCNPVPVGGCHPNYEIGTITYPVGGNSQLTFSENQLDTLSTWPGGGEPDSSAEDCNAQIALASLEGLGNQPSTPFVSGVTPQGTFTNPEFSGLQGSYLEGNLLYPGAEAGPIAVAQGGSHEGVLGQETFSVSANTITAFRLHFPYSPTAPFDDWVTCDLGDISSHFSFKQGIDPHTVTAYMSPNKDPIDGTYHSFAVFSNTPSSEGYIAVVDLDRMLATTGTTYVTRFPLEPHVCSNPPTALYWKPLQSIGTLPSTVVTFLPLQ